MLKLLQRHGCFSLLLGWGYWYSFGEPPHRPSAKSSAIATVPSKPLSVAHNRIEKIRTKLPEGRLCHPNFDSPRPWQAWIPNQNKKQSQLSNPLFKARNWVQQQTNWKESTPASTCFQEINTKLHLDLAGMIGNAGNLKHIFDGFLINSFIAIIKTTFDLKTIYRCECS